MKDNIQHALNNSDSDYEKKTLKYILSLRDISTFANAKHTIRQIVKNDKLRDTQITKSENQSSTVKMQFSEVLDIKSSSMIHKDELNVHFESAQK